MATTDEGSFDRIYKINRIFNGQECILRLQRGALSSMLGVLSSIIKAWCMKTNLKAVFLILLVWLCGAVSTFADDTLNNKSITDLHGLGLSDAVIIDKIKTSKCSFDTSVDALKALKSAGISGDVMGAMIVASSPAPAAAATAATPAPAPAAAAPAPLGDPNDPNAMHEQGIWRTVRR
jgi:hypothetical protein